MSDEKNKAEGKALRRPIDEVREELLKDPDVKEQADLLKVSLEVYVDKILAYAAQPDKPPAIMIVPDEALKKTDPGVPTVAEVESHLTSLVRGEIPIIEGQMQDGFNKGPTPRQYQNLLGAEESVPYKIPDKTNATPKDVNTNLPKPKFKP